MGASIPAPSGHESGVLAAVGVGVGARGLRSVERASRVLATAGVGVGARGLRSVGRASCVLATVGVGVGARGLRSVERASRVLATAGVGVGASGLRSVRRASRVLATVGVEAGVAVGVLEAAVGSTEPSCPHAASRRQTSASARSSNGFMAARRAVHRAFLGSCSACRALPKASCPETYVGGSLFHARVAHGGGHLAGYNREHLKQILRGKAAYAEGAGRNPACGE